MKNLLVIMGRFVRFGMVVLVILLLVGCGDVSEERSHSAKKSSQKDKTSATAHPETVATDPVTQPVETTAPSEPAETVTPTEPVVDPVSYRDVAVAAGYADVYDEIYRLMESGHIHKEYKYINDALLEIADYNYSPEHRFNRIAFAVAELNRDRSSEFVVVYTGDNKRIFAIYTHIDGEIVCVGGTGGKASTYWLPDSRFYYEGADGVYPYFKTDYESWYVSYSDAVNPVPLYYYKNRYGDDEGVHEITKEEYLAKQNEFRNMIFTFSPYPFC